MARIGALLLVLPSLFVGAPARAHAVLVEASPADGAILAEPPREVVLRFNEPVAPVVLRVLDAGAKPIADASQARAENETLTIALPPDLPKATYVVSYRVISIDSHPVSGAIVFSIGDTAAPARDTEASAANRATIIAVAATRALFLAGLLTSAGGILALASVARFAGEAVRRTRRILVLATLAALALGVLLLGVAGCNLAGTSLAGLASATAWRVASTSSLAKSLAVAVAGLVLILAALPRLGRSRLVALAGSLIAMASFALTGHAATAAPAWLMRWAVPLHALCAAFWLGALPLLIAAVRAGPAGEAYRLLARFSAQAVVVVIVILTLGVAIALVQIGHVAMLWQTPYGIVLMGKLAAVALLLAVAAHNKWHATPLLAGGGASAQRAFLRAIAAEYVLFAAIVGFTAALGQIEPPRAVVERDTRALARGQADFVATVTEAGRTVTLSVAPARAGHNALAVEVTDAVGQRMLPQEVSLEMSLPSAGIEPLRRKAEREPSGYFIYHSNDLALVGRWRIEVHVLLDDFTKTIASFDVAIR
jgi:copper transport protein